MLTGKRIELSEENGTYRFDVDFITGIFRAGAEPTSFACCEECVTETIRPECEEVDCGDVELIGGEVGVETEVGEHSEDERRRTPRKVAEQRMPCRS